MAKSSCIREPRSSSSWAARGSPFDMTRVAYDRRVNRCSASNWVGSADAVVAIILPPLRRSARRRTRSLLLPYSGAPALGQGEILSVQWENPLNTIYPAPIAHYVFFHRVLEKGNRGRPVHRFRSKAMLEGNADGDGGGRDAAAFERRAGGGLRRATPVRVDRKRLGRLIGPGRPAGPIQGGDLSGGSRRKAPPATRKNADRRPAGLP